MEKLLEEAYPELRREMSAETAERVLAIAWRDTEWLGAAALCMARLWLLFDIIAG